MTRIDQRFQSCRTRKNLPIRGRTFVQRRRAQLNSGRNKQGESFAQLSKVKIGVGIGESQRHVPSRVFHCQSLRHPMKRGERTASTVPSTGLRGDKKPAAVSAFCCAGTVGDRASRK